MRAVDVIARKRDGQTLTADEINWFIRGVVDGTVTDYQAAAWLMAVCIRGMSQDETRLLTVAMANSGRTLDLGQLSPRAVDKHSTGGVGDKISLVVGPIAAAAGVIVPKMSGRGLGITGGTLDKLESIPGLRVDLTEDEIIRQAADVGFVIAGQSVHLAPADGRLYALRDVTATVECLPLIVSSIMSKKLAGGAPSIVLDVKAGSGAFMRDVAAARELARSLVAVGTSCGRKIVAFVTRMDQPLGNAIGNALEVGEAIDVLQGHGPADVRDLALTLAGEMIALAGLAPSSTSGRAIAEAQIESGTALATLSRMIAAQGGDVVVIEDRTKLPSTENVHVERSNHQGWIAGIDAGTVGRAVLGLGAGREKKTDSVDHRVGVVLKAKVGERVNAGDVLYELHYAGFESVQPAWAALNRAYSWSDQPVEPPSLIVERIDESSSADGN